MRAIRAAYETPPRAYHSFAHVQAVLGHFHQVAAGPGWQAPKEVFLAILFHDAIYEAGRKDNEAKSADLARTAIETFLPRAGLDVARIEALIRLTARHGRVKPSEVDPDAAHFLDCDMAILGAPPEVFDAYDAAIAHEHRATAAFLYRLGRRRFLKGLLRAPRIFLSDFFHQRLDAPARENLRRALTS